MKTVVLGVGLSLALLLGLVVAHQNDATAEQPNVEAAPAQVTAQPSAQPVEQPQEYASCSNEASLSSIEGLEGINAIPYKKCSFNSDCKYGKCKSGKCGACSFNSDCKGWGKCKSGKCGACSFNSECKGFGGCSSGRCKKSPY